jgi:hypothetical protein
MRVIKLYDPERRGSWLGEVKPGEYPVFLRDGESWAERNVEGKPLAAGEASVCVVFADLAEAKKFCEQKIRELPHLRCDIYDNTGLAKPPLCTFGEKDWNPTPKALLWLAGLSILVSIPLFLWDWNRHGEVVLASIIAINLVAAGLRFLLWGLSSIDDRREQLKRTS